MSSVITSTCTNPRYNNSTCLVPQLWAGWQLVSQLAGPVVEDQYKLLLGLEIQIQE